MADDFTHPTRRQILKAAFWTASAVAATPLLSSSRTRWNLDAPLHVGVLLPASSRQPLLGANVYAGMQAYLDQPAARPAVTLHPLTFRPTLDGISSATERVMTREPVDLLVAAIDGQMAARLKPVLAQHDVPLIVVDSGANLLRADDRGSLIVYNTLHTWQTSWGMGAWAARSIGRRGVVLASCYESGYDAMYTFDLGFVDGGGVIDATHITHAPGRNGDLQSVLRAVARSRPDVVYASYSGDQAREFVDTYRTSPLAGQVPLLGSGALLDAVSTYQSRAALDVVGATAWDATLDTSVNPAFRAAFEARAGRSADGFGALGYDTARLIVEAARRSDRAAHLPDALANVAFDGPRGPLTVEATTRAVQTPLHLRSSRLAANDVLPAIHADDDRLAALHAAPKTGWLYPYLIA